MFTRFVDGRIDVPEGLTDADPNMQTENQT
jgi:hypothetical protein